MGYFCTYCSPHEMLSPWNNTIGIQLLISSHLEVTFTCMAGRTALTTVRQPGAYKEIEIQYFSVIWLADSDCLFKRGSVETCSHCWTHSSPSGSVLLNTTSVFWFLSLFKKIFSIFSNLLPCERCCTLCALTYAALKHMFSFWIGCTLIKYHQMHMGCEMYWYPLVEAIRIMLFPLFITAAFLECPCQSLAGPGQASDE